MPEPNATKWQTCFASFPGNCSRAWTSGSLNILHAAGDLDQVRELVTLAKKDWRDLILATEYELRDGKLVQTEWSKEMARKREARQNAARR